MRELPPNCPFLAEVGGTIHFSPPGVFGEDEEQVRDYRPIIGSVGRSYWLDHAASVRGASGLSADMFGVHATIRPNPEWLHAMKQADLWAKWGKNAD